MNTHYQKYINFLVKHNLYNKEILEYYQKEKPNFKKLQQKAKKLSRKHSK